MADEDPSGSGRPRAARGRRRSPGWVPNQHGAWAMLASPLLVGALAAGLRPVHALLALFWFAGYLAFFATSLWLRSGRRERYRRPVVAYGALAVVLGLITLLADPALARFAPLFLPPLAVGLWAAAERRERDLLVGLATVAGSALMTVVAYAAGGGPDTRRAWLLALVQLLYFTGTVLYVKSAIRERGNTGFLRISVAAHAAAALALVPVSPWLAGLFGLLTVRAAVVPPRRPGPRALGIGEIVATVAVAVVSLVTIR